MHAATETVASRIDQIKDEAYARLEELEHTDLEAAYGIKDACITATLKMASGHNLAFVDDTNQFGSTFKVRGASYDAAEARKEKPGLRRFIAATRGNHGAGAAFAAKRHGLAATIYGSDMVDVKRDRIKQIPNIEIRDYYPDFPAALTAAQDDAEEHYDETHYIHPYDSLRVITGQATLCLSALQRLAAVREDNRPARMYIPVGGGGLLAGTALAKAFKNAANVAVVGVEIEDKQASSLSDGTATTRGELPSLIIEESGLIEKIITVRVDQVAGAILRLEHKGVLGKRVEGAAALGYAGAVTDAHNTPKDTLILPFVTGTGISQKTYGSLGGLVINRCCKGKLL